MMQDFSKNKTLILLTGFGCNNNCVMCSLETSKKSEINRTTEEIALEMEKGRKQGFERVEFTGGEPGIREDIFYLIQYADDLGFKEIGISTNGRIFYYPQICRKFVESGLNRVNISLHGHKNRLHDAISRTKGSFEHTLKGIKNIQKFPSVSLEIASVVCRINFEHLKEIGFFIFNSLGIERWIALDLIPDGNALCLYKGLSVRLLDLSDSLVEISQMLSKKSHVSFFDFPLCLFPDFFRESNFVSFIVAKERGEISEQKGYNPTRIGKINNKYTDKHKIRVSVCKNCIFDARCGGIWRRYNELYGDGEIAVLANKNHCLKKRE